MYLKKEVINQFRKILREGKLYSISRFTVVPNIGAAKVVKHRYKLLFQFDTEVIPISDVEFPEASYSLETVESVVQMGQDSVYLIDVIGFLISVHDYSDVELDDGKKFKLVLIQLYSNGLNPSESYSIDSITFGNGFIVADVDDDFVNLSMNRSIKELRENDADGFFNVVAKIKSICNNFDWLYYSCVCGYLLEFFRSHFSCSECGRKIKNAVKKYKVLVNVEDATGSARFVLYDRSAALLFKKKLIEVLRNFDAEHSVVYATPYLPFFDDVIRKEVVFKVDRKKVGNRPNVGTFKVVNCSDNHRLLPPTIFSPIYEDVIQNLQHHDEISSLGSRISVNSDNMKSIEVDMEALGAAYNLTKPVQNSLD
ncbi:Replication factor-A carboxy-terminal domain protein [Arachis hypogaea]|nr:Replication factor-A carboxy-terminal domain protein [Arachis hypogaea]